jgi:NAD(P)-dependent dehydrogenase (short-subunit alcohol dehydrogenase family)
VIGIPFQAFYSMSKFALGGLAEALAYEVEPFGVDVTIVEPGNIRTDFTDSRRIVGGGDASPYAEGAAKAIGAMERAERNGAPAESVATVVERLLSSPRRPPRRRSVGKVDERAGLVAKRLLPYRLFERGAKRTLTGT